jgi:hypothetical protein
MIEIRHHLSGQTLFTSNTAIDLAGAVKEATKVRADLSGAGLSRADLSRADLYGANLSGADLSGADLSRADLYGANLSGAGLSRADLYGANLYGANLSGAGLSRANLYGADLSGADLSGAENADLIIARTRILPEGDLIGWKKLRDGVIAKLLIPADAKRSHAFGRKCRAEFAIVIEGEGFSQYEKALAYKPGAKVICDHWEEDWTLECAGGIHFFITKAEAENY